MRTFINCFEIKKLRNTDLTNACLFFQQNFNKKQECKRWPWFQSFPVIRRHRRSQQWYTAATSNSRVLVTIPPLVFEKLKTQVLSLEVVKISISGGHRVTLIVGFDFWYEMPHLVSVLTINTDSSSARGHWNKRTNTQTGVTLLAYQFCDDPVITPIGRLTGRSGQVLESNVA